MSLHSPVSALDSTGRLEPARRGDLVVASLAVGVAGLSAVLGFLARRGVWVLPRRSFCLSQLLFHAACPGCGLTRSFVALGRGDFAGAMALNPLGPILFAAILLAGAAHAGRLATGRPDSLARFDAALAVTILVALVARTIAFYFW